MELLIFFSENFAQLTEDKRETVTAVTEIESPAGATWV